MDRSTRKSLQALCLLVIPVFFFVVHARFAEARGPFYLSVNYDPDYAYLFNGLNLAIGLPPDHVDHPGIPLQLLAATYLKLVGPSSGSGELTASVLAHPELHLQRLNFILTITYSLALSTLAVWAWCKTNDFWSALLFQATPFLLANEFPETTRFRPETLILITALVMAVVGFVQARSEEPANKSTVILLSFLAATGLMAKITFFPFTLLPLFCLRTWKARGAYVLLTALGVTIWAIPLMKHGGKFIEWIVTLATHQGLYGTGTSSLLGSHYPFFLAELIGSHSLFLLMVISSVAVVLRNLDSWTKTERADKRLTQLLAGLIVVQVINFLMAGKFGEGRYVVPAIAFSGLNWAILLALVRSWEMGAKYPTTLQLGRVVGVVVIVVWASLNVANEYFLTIQHRDRHLLMARALEESFADRTTVYYYGSSSPYHALWFGNTYSGARYADVIRALFPDHAPAYFVEEWPGRTVWYSVAGPKVQLAERLTGGEEILLSGQQWPWPKGRNDEFLHQMPTNIVPELEPLRHEGDEAIYRLRVSTWRNP